LDMMEKPHILFVCSRNKWRSPTAEAIYANDDRSNRWGLIFVVMIQVH